jgi:hypothetical protein
MKITPAMLASLLLVGNIVCFGLYLYELHDARKLAGENARLQISLAQSEGIQKEFERNVQAAIDSQQIAGIYESKSIYHKAEMAELDLRSDGTGMWNPGFGSQRITWARMNGGTVEISRLGQFKIEAGDLIDPRGTRWLHIR